MSTLQHTPHHFEVRTRIALIALLAGAAATVLIAMVISNSGSTPVAQPQPTKAQLQQQLESVNGARFGLSRPSSTPALTPQQQLQAVAGARFGVTRPSSSPQQSSPKQTPQQQLQAVAGARYQQPVWIHRAD